MALLEGWRRILASIRGGPPGPMARRIGRAYTRRQLLAAESLTRREVAAMRAYPVPRLVGAIVEAATEADLPGAIESLLHRHLPAFDWEVESKIYRGLRKNGLIHASLEAPPDRRSEEPMYLELAGEVIAFGGRPAPAMRWIDLRPMNGDDQLGAEVPGPIQVRITAASYANTRFPGVGVPCYM